MKRSSFLKAIGVLIAMPEMLISKPSKKNTAPDQPAEVPVQLPMVDDLFKNFALLVPVKTTEFYWYKHTTGECFTTNAPEPGVPITITL